MVGVYSMYLNGSFPLNRIFWILCFLLPVTSQAKETSFPSWAVGVRGELVQTKMNFDSSVLAGQNVSGDFDLFNVGLFAQKEFFQEKKFSATLVAFVGWSTGKSSDNGSIEVEGLRGGGEVTGNVNFHHKGLRIQPLIGIAVSPGKEEIVSKEGANPGVSRLFRNDRVSPFVGCRFLDRYENLMSSVQLGYLYRQTGGVKFDDGNEESIEQTGIEYKPLYLSIHLGYLF